MKFPKAFTDNTYRNRTFLLSGVLLILVIISIAGWLIVNNDDSSMGDSAENTNTKVTVKNINSYDLRSLRTLTIEEVRNSILQSEEKPYDTLYSIDTIPENQNCESKDGNVKLCLPSDPPIDWDYEYETNRSKNLYLHTWYMLDEELSKYSESEVKDEKIIIHSADVASDWIRQNPLEIDNNEDGNFAWYDMAVSNRGYRLAYILDQAFRKELVNEDQLSQLWISLLDHLEYLEKDSNIVFRNNHGLFQAAGQKSIARRFLAVSDDFHGIYNESAKRLSRMLDLQFTAEGVHKEHSPDYHRMIYEVLISLEDADLLESTDIDKTKLMGDALYSMIYPDNRILNIGDSDRRLVDKTRFQESTSSRLSSWANGDILEASGSQNMNIFHDSGLAVVKVLPGGSYLAQQSGFHSRFHKHADNLSFVLYENDQNILIDSGKYAYLGRTEEGSIEREEGFWYSDSKRMFVESTRAHNAVSIDGKDHKRVNVDPYISAIKNYDYVDGVYFIYSSYVESGVSHGRVLIYSPSEWLVVYDVLSDDKNHDYTQYFNFDPAIQLKNTTGDIYTSTIKNEKVLHVSPLLSVENSRLVRGQEEPELLGWNSPVQNEFIANQNLQLNQTGTKVGMATLFLISDSSSSLTTNLEANKTTFLGGSVDSIFSWTTAGKKTNLSLKIQDEKASFEISEE